MRPLHGSVPFVPLTLARMPGARPTSSFGRTARRVLSGVAIAVLLGCSAMPMAPGTARAQDDAAGIAAPDATAATPRFDGDLMYELMLAELAGRRGQLDVAVESYLRASERSDDAHVSDRAARLAMFARRWPEAERAARRWLALDDESRAGREVLARALLLQGETDAAASEYVALVAMATTQAAVSGQDDLAGEGDVADTEVEDALSLPAADGVPSDGAAEVIVSGTTRAAVLEGLFATLQGEDPTRAMTVWEALSKAYPDEAEAHLGVARLALANNDRARALEAVDSALAAAPASGDAQLIRARILLASGRAEEAFAGLEAALAVAPDDVPLRLGNAQLLAESGRVDVALSEFEALHAMVPDDADVQLTIGLLALDAGRTEAAHRYLEALLLTGRYDDQANFYLARIDDADGARESAISRYEAVRPGQLYPDARIRAAELHALGGDVEAGRERLRDLAAEFPDPLLQPRLLVVESRMLQQAGKPAEAVSVLSEGLTRFPENGDLLYARALAADGAGDPDTLERDLERLIEMEPDNAHALNALGYHLADADRRLDEAAIYLERAVALEPDDAAILDSLGWLRYRQGELAEAVELLRRAHTLYPDGEIAAHLGEVLWMQGEHEEARSVWKEALAESPDDDVLQRVVKKFVE